MAPDYTSLTFPPSPTDRPFVVLNTVTTLDGRAAIGGASAGIGSQTDGRLMRELRAHADVVLVGAGTLRTHDVSPRVRTNAQQVARRESGRTVHPISAVLSRSGMTPTSGQFFTASDFDAFVYLSDRCPVGPRKVLEGAGREVVTVPHDEPILATLHHMKQALGADLVLLESGATLNHAFFEADVVDERFLTLSPTVAGGQQSSAVGEGSNDPLGRTMDLLLCDTDAASGEVFLRYRRHRS